MAESKILVSSRNEVHEIFNFDGRICDLDFQCLRLRSVDGNSSDGECRC